MAITVEIKKNPLYGSVYWNGSNFVYTPNTGFVGRDSYIYTISDANSSRTITNYVDTTNRPPIANDTNLTIDATNDYIIDLSSVVSDTDGLIYNLKLSKITTPSIGKAFIADDLKILYRPNGYNNTDSLRYTISDGQYEVSANINLTLINGKEVQLPTYIQTIVSTIQSDLSAVSLSANFWNQTYTLISGKSAVWNRIDTQRFEQVANIVESSSANWNAVADNKPIYDNATTVVQTNSASWEDVKNKITNLSSNFSTNSSHWTSSDNTVQANSANWITNYNNVSSLYSNYNANSGIWLDTYNVVSTTSGLWDKTPLTNLLSSNSGNWQSNYNTLCANSGVWNSTIASFNNFKTDYYLYSADWVNVFNTVFANSAINWDNNLILTFLSSNSSNWQNAYNILTSNSGSWNSSISALNTLTNTFSANSSYWQNAYNVVTANSGLWDKSLINNLLSANSGYWNNSFNTVCANSGAWNSNVQNYINLTNSYSTLSTNWINTYNTVTANSGAWDKTQITNLLSANSSNWASSYNSVCSNSADWSNTVQNFTNLTNVYSTISANWNTAYNLVSANSGLWDKTPITNLLSSNSGNWDSSYNTVTANSGGWSSAVQNFTNLTNVYSTISTNWNTAYNLVSTNSGIWDKTPITNLLSSNSGYWDSSYTILCGNSSSWNGTAQNFTDLSNVYSSNSGKWQSNYLFVQANSAAWDTSLIYNLITSNSANWDDAAFIVNSTSANWNTAYDNVTSTSANYVANSGYWNNTYSFVNANSSNWGGSAPFSILSGNSATWNSAYNIITANSSTWNNLSSNDLKYNNLSTIINNNSGNWNNSFTILTTNSSNWNNIATTINTNSATWLSGSNTQDLVTLNLYSSGNVILYGSLTALGSITELNASVVSTSSFSINNNGFTDALRVTKTQNAGALALFNNSNSTVLYVSPSGLVGINTVNPTTSLTVSGNISASGFVYGQVPDQYNVFATNSGKYETSSNFFSSNSANVVSLLTAKSANYDVAYTYLNGVSSSISNLLLSAVNYNNAYVLLTAQSANNNSSYTYLTTNSGTVGTDTVYRNSLSAKYETSYGIAQSLSAQPCQINFIFDGGGDVVNAGAIGFVQIPSRISIIGWTLLSDVANTCYVQVLCSDYTNFGINSIDITGYSSGDYPLLNAATKNASTTMTGWLSNINADSILRFKLPSNSGGNSITLSLKCLKYSN